MTAPIPDYLLQSLADEPTLDWFSLGLALGLESRSLTSLGQTLNTPAVLSRKMLDAWVDEHGGEADMSEEEEEKLKDQLRAALKKCGRGRLSEEVRDDRDFSEIFNHLGGKLTKIWKDLARYLKFETDTIDEMVGPVDEGPERRKIAWDMLTMWKGNSDDPSFTALIKALRILKNEKLALDVEKTDEYKEYLSNQNPQPPPPQPQPPVRDPPFTASQNRAEGGCTSVDSNDYLPAPVQEVSPSQPRDDHSDRGDGKDIPTAGKENSEYYKNDEGELSPVMKDEDDIAELFLPDDHETKDEILELDTRLTCMAGRMDQMEAAIKREKPRPVVIALLDSGIDEGHPDFKEANKRCKQAQLDSGIDEGHPDFKDAGMIIGRKNFVLGDDDDLVKDRANHGTACAGIIMQYAPSAKILNLKVLPDDGTNPPYRALKYITQWDREHPDEKVDVISISFGRKSFNKEQAKMIDEFASTKVIVCAAHNAGQEASNTIGFPANHEKVIAIGSCNRKGKVSDHSSVGEELRFLFHGENVTSTSSRAKKQFLKSPKKYRRFTGTSFATPNAAAVIAVILAYIEAMFSPARREEFTNTRVMKRLLKKTTHSTYNPYTGFGLPEVDEVTYETIKNFIKRGETRK